MKALAVFFTALLCLLVVKADNLPVSKKKLLVCYRDRIPYWEDNCSYGLPEYCRFLKMFGNCTHVVIRSSGDVDMNTAYYKGLRGNDEIRRSEWYSFDDNLRPPPMTLQNINPVKYDFFDGSQVVSTEIGRRRLIESAIKSLKSDKFVGLDVVVEEKYLEDTMQLLLEMGPEFHKNDLILTALFPATLGKEVDLSYVARNLDFISIKSFRDNNVGAVTMLQSPLYSEEGWSLDDSVKLYVGMGVPREKIVIGIPTFAVEQRLENPDYNFPGSNTRMDVNLGNLTSGNGQTELDKFPREGNGVILRRDGVSHAPYVADYYRWISYDDEISVKSKVKYINENDLGGAMLWPSDEDMQNNCRGNANNCPGLPFAGLINATFGEER